MLICRCQGPLTSATSCAEGLRHLILIRAEDVADDLPDQCAAYCGRPDIRQALGPGWIGLRSDRQYADQPDWAGDASSWRRANNVLSTVFTASSSSSVGEPLTTKNCGFSSPVLLIAGCCRASSAAGSGALFAAAAGPG